MKAREVMNPAVCRVRWDDDVADAAGRLARSGCPVAAVLDDDGRVVGTLAPADLTRPGRVGTVMRTPVVSLTPGADVAAIEAQLEATGDSCVFIADGERVWGTVDRTDLALSRLWPAGVPVS